MLPSEIIIIIVLYKTKFMNSKAFITLNISAINAKWKSLDLVFYDNSPEFNKNLINQLNQYNYNIRYIPDYNNSGVSRAYNQAFKLGKEMGKKYILLLDQDTEIPISYCEKLLSVNDNYNLVFPKLYDKGLMISPCKYFLGRGSCINPNKIKNGENEIRGKMFLNSGSLISISLFEKVGGYDESVPLYFSDFNFFQRVKKYENNYYLIDQIFKHDMSSNDEKDLNKFVKRFELYCNGAYYCFKSPLYRIIMILNIFLRTTYLTFKYQNIIFIKRATNILYENIFK